MKLSAYLATVLFSSADTARADKLIDRLEMYDFGRGVLREFDKLCNPEDYDSTGHYLGDVSRYNSTFSESRSERQQLGICF